MNVKKVLQIVASLLLASGLLWYVLRGQDLAQIWAAAQKTNLFWISLAAFTSLLSHWSRAHRWKLLIEPLGYTPTIFQTFSAVVTGYAVNYAIPRLGELTRCGMLYRTSKLPITQGVGTVVAERILDVISLACLAVLTFVIEFDQLMAFISQMQAKATGQPEKGTGLMIFVMIGFIMISVIIWIFRNQIYKIPLAGKIICLVKGLVEGALSVTKVKNGGIVVFHSVFIWLMYYLTMYFAMLAFPETSHLGPGVALAMLLISSLGMIIPVPGGIGAYHYLVSNGLAFYGISLAGGVIFAFISHTLQMVEILVLTGIMLSIVSFNSKKEI